MSHLRIKNKFRFTVSVLLFLLLLTLILGGITSKAYNVEEIKYDEVIVSEGDTLWSIASNYGGNINETIYNIKKFNHLTSCTIYVDQIIKVPIAM